MSYLFRKIRQHLQSERNYVTSVIPLEPFGPFTTKYKKAVQRNRMKRLMREVYRKNKKIFPVGDIILFAKYAEKLPTYQTIFDDIKQLVQNKNFND